MYLFAVFSGEVVSLIKHVINSCATAYFSSFFYRAIYQELRAEGRLKPGMRVALSSLSRNLGQASLVAGVALPLALGVADGAARAQGVTVTPQINTFAGNGTAAFTGDMGQATATSNYLRSVFRLTKIRGSEA